MRVVQRRTFSLIIPVYYNAEALPELYDRLCRLEYSLSTRGMDLELIMIDDGSRDDSFERMLDIKRKRPATKILRLTRNFGVVACVSTGFPFVTGDCLGTLAADLQDPPEQLLPMLDAWEQGTKLVFSYRRSRKDPLVTRLLAALYYRVLTTLVVRDFPEGGVDMILMDKSLLPHLMHLGRNVNYQLYMFWLGFESKQLSYDRQERKHGKSRWVFRKKFYYFLDTITGFSVTPLRLVSIVGVGVSLLSLSYGLVVLFSAVFIHKSSVPGFATLALLISFSAGMMMTMLSIIGEYLWRIFQIISHHPKSVIAEEHLQPTVPERT